MRLFTGTLWAGSSSFSPVPIGPEDFEVIRGGLPPSEQGLHMRLLGQYTFRRLARTRGWDVVETVAANAQNGGLVNRLAYESLRDEILADLERARPVDAVCLCMFGAMRAWGYPDCEGDLVSRIRASVGPRIPIGLEFNLHGNLTRTVLDHATAVVTLKEYPHTDYADRAAELFTLVAQAAEGRLRPRMSAFDCHMVGHYYTDRQPMRGFVDRMTALEGKHGVLSVSLVHGFLSVDDPEMGTKALVITDDRPAEGEALARELGHAIFAIRESLLPHYLSVDDALGRALDARGRPVVIAECSDKGTSGDGGDCTVLLRALLDRGVSDVAVSPLYDPVAAALAMAAGEGAELDLRIGGKVSRLSGDPLDLRVRVGRIRRDFRQRHVSNGIEVGLPLGDGVAVHAGALDVVLSTRRQQTYSLDCFTGFGIEPRTKRIVVVKSSVEFRRAFGPIAAETLMVHTRIPRSGDQSVLMRTWPFQHITRPKWPLDDVTTI